VSEERTTPNAISRPDPGPDKAAVRRSWWPGWIWAIPIAAILVVGWLGFRALFSGGEDATITFQDAHGLKPKNTNVEYRGMNVGRVTSVDLNDRGDAVIVTVSIEQSATRFLKSGTRFWLRGASPSLSNPQSLSALLSGPTIVMEPGAGQTTHHFVGLTRKPVSPAGNSATLLYAVELSGEAGALQAGDPVKLEGFTVGEVREVGFDFDPDTGTLSMPGTLALYPALFHIKGQASPPDSAAVRSEMGALINTGLRVKLEQDPPLLGSYHITLARAPDLPRAKPAAVNGMPLIPTAPGGGVGSLITRINRLPIEQIARNVADTTQHLQALAASPKLKQALAALAASLTQIQQTTARAGPELTTLITRLQRASDDVDRTVRSTDGLVNGSATEDGVGSLIQEATEASRSVRSLADYLDRHPEALVKGRSELP
jgi:paraquat-inducible protein B